MNMNHGLSSMVFRRAGLATALGLVLAAGCAAEPADGGDAAEEAPARIAQALVDASAIVQFEATFARPSPQFVSAAALADSQISKQIGGEALVETGARADLVLLDSAHFRVQKNASRGEMFLRQREELWVAPVPKQVDTEVLKADSVDRLQTLGIPSSEMGVVSQRKILHRKPGEATGVVDDHMTVVDRAFNGIPVRGSRAVVFHDVAGAFTDMMVHWREVAPDGPGVNQWTTSMSPQAIVARATSQLASLGLEGRSARLGYRYVPRDEKRADGKTSFAIKCVAVVYDASDATDDASGVEASPGVRPVEVDVDLDP